VETALNGHTNMEFTQQARGRWMASGKRLALAHLTQLDPHVTHNPTTISLAGDEALGDGTDL
jgi:hypothetical protein